MTHTAERKNILENIKNRLSRGCDWLAEPESGLVVCWFDIVKTLVFVAAIWACLGPLIDTFYIFISGDANGFYTAQDIKFTSDLYNFWRYIPIIAIGLVVFYAINYSNWKRDQ
jgi:hypothetical protein